jgi:hypothetical protein
VIGEHVPAKRHRVEFPTPASPSYDALDLNIFGEHASFEQRTKRRRHPLLKVFPSYDKCNSLLHFPTAMTKHLNAGDFSGLSKLFSSHLHQNCDVMYTFLNLQTSGAALVRLFEFMNDLHPDSFMCVHHTKVVGSQIKATIHAKITVCWKIHDAIVRMTTDPWQRMLIPMFADENLIKSITGNQHCQIDQDDIAILVRERIDVEAYVQMDLTLTIDDASKRVSALCVDSWPTSVKATTVTY